MIIEDSPWAYLCRHAVHIAPDLRALCQTELAQLKLPEFTIILGTSGIEVGRRHPNFKNNPMEWSTRALRQM